MSQAKPHGCVVIAGGSGFVGRYTAKHLSAAGFEVHLLSRNQPQEDGPWTWSPWDARTVGDWAQHLDGAAGLVNLVGRTVDCIKTPARKDEILRSRVEATRVLGKALRGVNNPPPVWVQMSTAHIYGDPPEVVCDEHSPTGLGMAPQVGKAWEAEYETAVLPNMRRVVLRTSFVVGRDGGALKRLGLLARIGLGGTVGHGRQGMSWLHEKDMARLFERALTHADMQGIYVATAPNSVSNAEFMRVLRQAVGMPVGLPAMAWMVRIGAPLLMRTDPELALYGRYCVSRRLEEEGFTFEFPTLGPALKDIYDADKSAGS